MKTELGDKVLLYDETVRWCRSRKLRFQWIWPYGVVELNKVNATIWKGRKLKNVHVNGLKPFYWIGGDCKESVSTTSIFLQMAAPPDCLGVLDIVEVAVLSSHRDLGYGTGSFDESARIYCGSLVISIIVSAQQGIRHPQILWAHLIVNALMCSSPSFPPDTLMCSSPSFPPDTSLPFTVHSFVAQNLWSAIIHLQQCVKVCEWVTFSKQTKS
jgi:hypothetical protein